MIDPAVFEQFLVMARRHGVSKFAIEGLGTVELEYPSQLPSGAPSPPPQSASAPPPFRPRLGEDLCACGHSLEVEHSDAGCLLGCSGNLCASTGNGGTA